MCREIADEAPSADVIILTAGTQAMAQAYESIYNSMGRHGEIVRHDIPLIAIADPMPSMGNGAALAYAVHELYQRLPSLSRDRRYPHLKDKDIQHLRIVVIQAGGFGSRLAITLAHGSKPLMKIPCNLNSNTSANILDYVIKGAYKFTQALRKQNRAGLVVLNGDGLLVTVPQLQDGANLIVYPETKQNSAGSLGVVLDDGTVERKITEFKEKPDLEELNQLVKGDIAFANTASCIYTQAPEEYNIFIESLLRIANIIIEAESNHSRAEVDTSNDMLLPCSLKENTAGLEAHRKKRTEKAAKSDEQFQAIDKFYTKIYDEVILNFPDMYATGEVMTTFYRDLGSTATYIDEITGEGILSRMFGFEREIYSAIDEDANVSKHAFCLLSMVMNHVRVGNSIIYRSLLQEDSYVGDGSLVYVQGRVDVGNHEVLMHVPVQTDDSKIGYALVYFGARDNVKAKIEDPREESTIFGQDFFDWATTHGLVDDDLNLIITLDKLIPLEAGISLFDLPIWPVTEEDTVDMGLIGWMSTQDRRPPQEYLQARKVSLKEISRNQTEKPKVFNAIMKRDEALGVSIEKLISEKKETRTNNQVYPWGVPNNIHQQMVKKYGAKDLAHIHFTRKEDDVWEHRVKWRANEIDRSILTKLIKLIKSYTEHAPPSLKKFSARLTLDVKKLKDSSQGRAIYIASSSQSSSTINFHLHFVQQHRVFKHAILRHEFAHLAGLDEKAARFQDYEYFKCHLGELGQFLAATKHVRANIASEYLSQLEFYFLLANLWRILAEQNLLGKILPLLTSQTHGHKISTFRKLLSEAIANETAKNEFIQTRMKDWRALGVCINAREAGKDIEEEWSTAKTMLEDSTIYFEGIYADIFYTKDSELAMARVAPGYFVDYLTDTAKLHSFFGKDVRADILLDKVEAEDIHKELALYKRYPELYDIINALNSDDWNVNLQGLKRLENILVNSQLGTAISEEALRLITATLGKENSLIIQKEAQRILTHVYSARPLEFPDTGEIVVAKLGDEILLENMVISVSFNPFVDTNRMQQFRAQALVATNLSNETSCYRLKAMPYSDSSVKLRMYKTHSLKAKAGIIHIAVQTKQGKNSAWIFSQNPEANITIYVQPDLRGQMIYQAWPGYLGVYDEQGNVRYDETGRAISGTFETIEKKLPFLSEKGYSYIYVMGVYQLDKPENIIGQVGPDASIFSPFRFTVSEELGGEEGLRRLVEKAERFGIKILVDLIPHVNQNFKDLPEWAIVKVRRAEGKKVIRRFATDGSINHENGLPVEWHDSAMINWRDKRALDAYVDLLKRLAGMGVGGVRLDVAHRWGMMLPIDKSLHGKQRLFGQVSSWDRNQIGGFKVVNEWDVEQANPLLVYFVSEITKQYPNFVFIGENYAKYIQLIKSGIVPMDSGTHDDLERVIINGESAQDVLNSHFRWLFSELPKGSQLVTALELHDYSRLMDRWTNYGPHRLDAAVWTWLATTRGAIMVYNRQEEGEVHRIRIDNFTYHGYNEANRQRYYAQLDFEREHKETIQQFYNRALKFYKTHSSLHTGENYIVNTNHQRVFSIVRFNESENHIFVINNWGETSYVEIELTSLWDKLKVENSADRIYLVKDYVTGKNEVFTGEELIAERLQVRLEPYRASILLI